MSGVTLLLQDLPKAGVERAKTTVSASAATCCVETASGTVSKADGTPVEV